MKGLNVISLNTVGLNTVPLNSVDLNSFASSGRGKGSGLASGLVASYRCYDKTNDDADRDILKDLTGKGHDISLKNFAFSGGSGYGKYNYTVSSSSSYVEKLGYNKFKIKNVESGDWLLYFNNGLTNTFVLKFKVSGLLDGDKLNASIDGAANVIDKNGYYSFNCSKVENKYHLIITGAVKEYNCIIEFIPDYKGALVSDGVDDYGICENFSVFTKEKGYTVCALRKWLDFSNKKGATCGKRSSHDPVNGAFNFELNISTDGNIRVDNFGASINTKIDSYLSFAYLNSKQYNSLPIGIGNFEDSDKLGIFATPVSVGSSTANIALYALEIYNRDLTDEEIAKVKARMIKEYEEKTGEKYVEMPVPIAGWTAKGKTNEDSDRATLKDVVSGKYTLTLKNFAFSGGSGYGKYIQDFSQFVLNGYNPNISIETNYNKISVSYKEGVNLGIYITKSNLIWKSFKVKVTTSDYNNGEIGFSYYSGKVNKEIPFVINGITEIIPPTDQDTVNYAGLFIFNKSDKAGQFTIEQIPEYQDALVFDGIDDYAINKSMPVLQDYTIIAKREILAGGGCLISKGGNLKGEFVTEGYYTYSVYSYGVGTTINSYPKNGIIYQTKSSYNGIPISHGNANGDIYLTVGKINETDNRYNSIAFYCAYLFDRSLTPEEIELFIKTNIDKDYTLPNN